MKTKKTNKTNKTKKKRTLFRKIINFFIATFLFFVFLFIVFIAFTQTRTFKDYLKDKIILSVNSEIEGTFNLESIDGTIFTSLKLNNLSIYNKNDTLLHVHKIELTSSPVHLLFKKILIRKLVFDGLDFNIKEDSIGNWNIGQLGKKSAQEKAETYTIDTSTDKSNTEFPFLVQANEIEILNSQFSRIDFASRNKIEKYETLNTNDLRIENINLSANVLANVNNPSIKLSLNNFSANLNLSSFNVKNISGIFDIRDSLSSVSNLKIRTDSSDIILIAKLNEINLFGELDLSKFEKYPLSLQLNANPFSFNDLSTFVPETKILNGKPNILLDVEGDFGDFNIHNLSVDVFNTSINIKGRLYDLHTPANLKLDIAINNSTLSETDARRILPYFSIPNFYGLGLSNTNIVFKGEPTDFFVDLEANVDSSLLKINGNLDVKSPIMNYNFDVTSLKLNVLPIIGLNSNLNLDCEIAGEGVAPEDLNSEVQINIKNSVLDGHEITDFGFNATGKDSVIKLGINSIVDKAHLNLNADFNYTHLDEPNFSVIGKLDNFQADNFNYENSPLDSLNIYFNSSGRNFDIDSLVGNFSLRIDSSIINENFISVSEFELLVGAEQDYREINLVSDFADVVIDGNFSLKKAIDLLMYEGQTITDIVQQRVNDLNPLNIIKEEEYVLKNSVDIPLIVDESLEINYRFLFKDFELISNLLGGDKLDISGSGSGTIENNSSNFSIKTEFLIDYLVHMNDDKLIYLSDINSNLKFSRDNHTFSFDNLFGSLSLNGSKYFGEANINNITADFVFNQNNLFFNLGAEVEQDIQIETDGSIEMTYYGNKFNFEYLSFNYKDVEWTNLEPFSLDLDEDILKLDGIVLENDSSRLSLNGLVTSEGEQNIAFTVKNLPGKILSKYFIENNKMNFDANFNLIGKINGFSYSPKININFDLDGINLNEENFGNLICQAHYENKAIETNFYFVKPELEYSLPIFEFGLLFPVDLSFKNMGNRILNDRPFYFSLNSSNFDIAALGNLIPFVTNQHGILDADLFAEGTLQDVTYTGHLNLSDATYKIAPTNIIYNAGIKLKFENQKAQLDSLKIVKKVNSPNPPSLSGNGSLTFKGLGLDEALIALNGDVSIMDKQIKGTNKLIYGDLLIGTDDELIYRYKNDKSEVEGNLGIRKMDLTYLSDNSSADLDDKKFIYEFVVDSSKIDPEEIRLKDLLLTQQQGQTQNELKSIETSAFDYKLKIGIEQQATIEFVFSPAWNHKLVANLIGDAVYENKGGDLYVQGAFDLQEGSRLEYFKVFDAVGTIRFENDLSNPFLDVTATYLGTYTKSATSTEEKATEDVAVKIKLKGLLKDLGQNLADNPDNISVYVGARNIQNNFPDSRYDALDALSFIFSGKFKADLTSTDKANLAYQTALSNTGSSLFSSVLTRLLNSSVGDLVNNIEVSPSGEYYNYNVSGRFQNLRYTFGGNSRLFNLNNTTIRIDYFWSPKFIMRLEKKNPILHSEETENKIYEIGLKYKFEF